MVADLLKSFKEYQISVLSIPPEKYSIEIIKSIKQLAKIKKRICFVSLNKPYTTIEAELEKAKVPKESFVFIDAVSSKVSAVEKTKNVTFVSSPRALTELSISLNKAIELWGPDAVFFDSLSTLLVYEGTSSILRFVHSVSSSLRVKGKSCIFTIISKDLKEELSKDLSMFADRIIEII